MLSESDPDLRQMAEMEVLRLEPQLAAIEQDLQILLLPKDPNDEKNIVLEIRKARAATRPLSSLTKSFACTLATPKSKAGKWKSPPSANPPSAA